MKHEINELYPSARHAYIATGLAVKTSRPHSFNERALLCTRSRGQADRKDTFFQRIGPKSPEGTIYLRTLLNPPIFEQNSYQTC